MDTQSNQAEGEGLRMRLLNAMWSKLAMWRISENLRYHAVLPQLQVMARCSPQDKLTMVRRLKEMGEVCPPPWLSHSC